MPYERSPAIAKPFRDSLVLCVGWRASTTARRYARTAGLLLLLSFAAGGFGEAYVPSRIIVQTDAAATAHNVRPLGLYFASASSAS